MTSYRRPFAYAFWAIVGLLVLILGVVITTLIFVPVFQHNLLRKINKLDNDQPNPSACPRPPVEPVGCNKCPVIGKLAVDPAIISSTSTVDGDSWKANVPYQAYDQVMPLSKRVICVDASAVITGDGSCWQRPFRSFQDAIDKATANPGMYCMIWVADGTYYPSKTYAPSGVIGGALSLPEYNPGTNRVVGTLPTYASNKAEYDKWLQTFQMVDGVSVYGGFQGKSHPGGGETSTDQRVRGAYPSLFVGRTAQDHSHEVYHVFAVSDDISLTSASMRFDGITIVGGNAIEGPNFYIVDSDITEGFRRIYSHDHGGAVYIFANATVDFHDVLFDSNAAWWGSVTSITDGSHVTVTASRVTQTRTATGAFYGITAGPTNIDNDDRIKNPSVFSMYHTEVDNPDPRGVFYADFGVSIVAGWVYLGDDEATGNAFHPLQATLAGCYFHHSSIPETTFNFGAIFSFFGTVVVDTTLMENMEAQWGRAVVGRTHRSNFTMRNSVIRHISGARGAFDVGFQIFPDEICTLLIGFGNFENCHFHNCTAINDHGGAIRATSVPGFPDIYSMNLFMNGNLFRNCSANDYGGAVFIVGNYTMIDNTFIGNGAGTDGGAVFIDTIDSNIAVEIDNLYCQNTPNAVSHVYNVGISSIQPDSIESELKYSGLNILADMVVKPECILH